MTEATELIPIVVLAILGPPVMVGGIILFRRRASSPQMLTGLGLMALGAVLEVITVLLLLRALL